MQRKILVVNSGSSTLKFKLFALPKEEVIVKGLVDRLGLDHSVFEITYKGKSIPKKYLSKTMLKQSRF